MSVLEVRHLTRYRYRRPVRFGEHRAMVRPRASHDLHLLSLQLETHPPAELHWVHDVFSNSIAVLDFTEPSDELRVLCSFRVANLRGEEPRYRLAPEAETWPFAYSPEERTDLGATLEPHHPDPEGAVTAFARSFVDPSGRMPTLELLRAINRAIPERFRYEVRHEPGTRPPAETLRLGSGSCRDFALLMMEAVRRLGFAARFVSGYLYDPALDGAGEAMVGAGSTHAWLEVYLPGSGWIEFDPTNALEGSRRLVRVAVAREPHQAVPLAGTYIGDPEDFLSLEVEVEVRAVAPAGPAPATPPFTFR